ncbi:thiamine pyrophosphate-dependent enzyme, partial [Achromobacter xylosoxidans]
PMGSGHHARVVHVSLDQYVHNGWSMDHQALPQTDLTLLCDPDTFVASVVENPDFSQAEKRPSSSERPYPRSQISKSDTISIAQLAADVEAAAAELDMSLIRLPLGWSGDLCDFDHPLDYLGYDGGGGIGSGPGMAVGAALGLKDSGRLPVAIIGDGDYLMGVSALWTAANARIPLLIIVANNRSFFNDELHQERVARDRSRPIENRWIGQRIDDPAPDLAGLARAQGLTGFGPVSEPAELVGVLRNAVEIVRAGGSVVVDVHVTPGYSPAMSSGMTRSHDD